jgi:hypothetical protein
VLSVFKALLDYCFKFPHREEFKVKLLVLLGLLSPETLDDFPDAPEIGLPDLYSGKSEKSKEVLSRITSETEFE